MKNEVQVTVLPHSGEYTNSNSKASSFHEVETEDLICLSPEDPKHPQSWSLRKKCLHTFAYGVTTLGAQFAASVISPSVPQIGEQFHVGEILSILTMSIYVLGNAAGPMLFAPLSELYGRKVGVFIPYFVSAIIMLLCANVNSIAAVIVLRFFAGAFAAAPVVSSGGAMSDIWAAEHRAAAMVLYSDCIVIGNSFGPIFGALLDSTGPYGWRWCCWLSGLMGCVISIANFALLSESYLPVLDARHASQLRHRTGKWHLHSESEEQELTLHHFFSVHMARPVFLFLTPIVFLMASFASFVFGVMYLIITSVGNNFMEQKGFPEMVAYLPLIGNAVGFCLGGFANLCNSRSYARKARQGVASPEDRLPAMMYLAWLLPAGCFIYAWTLQKDTHWFVPCIGIVMVGAGIAIVFQGCLNYIVDAYTRYAASAIAANTVLRSLYGGLFPLFSKKLYRTLGVQWGGSLVGFMGLAMLPIPFVFYFYGPKIRRNNPYAHLIS